MTTQIRVLTLNILNKADRWAERLPLLREGFAAIRPDVAGLQEVFFPFEQERMIADSAAGAYSLHRASADRPERGNSLMLATHLTTRGRLLEEPERLALGHGRSALKVRLALPDRRVQIAVTHLHHLPPDEAIRDAQVAALVRWLEPSSEIDATIVTGDFNAEPDEIAALRMVDAGYRSAYLEANQANPPVTFPSGLQAPDREEYAGWPEGCLDYVWIAGAVTSVSAELCFDRPSQHDPTLYASDHFGIMAVLAFA